MTEHVNGSGPETRQQVAIPPLMAQVPAQINVLELDRVDGIKQVVLLVNSVNGTFGFPLDPGPARIIGEALIGAANRTESALLTPPSIILGPSGQPLSFG